MPTAYLETPRCRVKLHSERLLVLAPSEKDKPDTLLQDLPIAEVDRLVLRDDVQITTQAVCALLRANRPIHYQDTLGRFLGCTLPPQSPDAPTRLRQYQRAADVPFALEIARRLTAAKIHNQRRLLQRVQGSRADAHSSDPPPHEPLAHPGPAPDLAATLDWLAGVQQRLPSAASLDEIRGHEGATTARYYQAWAAFLPPEFPFERRSARPPHNPVNACISYGAVLLYHECLASLHRHGLDPGFGALHATEAGRYSLALDLIEPFRPALVEAMTLRLFAHRMLQAGDFEPSHGGIYLAPSGRRTFLREYETRLQREFLSEHAGHRTTLRQQLAAQALHFKTALDDPETFSPFRLN
jgi:CRISPR-associated endonuclease Cas1